jgi:hypothetical protein
MTRKNMSHFMSKTPPNKAYREIAGTLHPTLGILARCQAFFYALSFFWLDGFAVPAPAQVTPAVGQFLAKSSKQVPRVLFYF